MSTCENLWVGVIELPGGAVNDLKTVKIYTRKGFESSLELSLNYTVSTMSGCCCKACLRYRPV